MDLKSKIQEDLKESMKQKEELKSSVLRFLNASFLNKEKDKRYKLSKENSDFPEKDLEEKSKLSEEEMIDVVSSEVKKRKESIVEFEKGKREDLIKREKDEIEILSKYLPEQISEEEIRKIVSEAIQKTGAKEMKEMGKIMSEIMPKTKGRADGSLVSKIVKEFLS